ncbi:glucose-methanol-choline oxidoreductase [Desulfatibacillum aliphaticivorans]|uniref:Glucose-methanol-choline oxidoreductase n=1 Tax=Desulfatibacillum aliphaticivorans TaxID=218208 RepID=B8FFA3_DESAL|nr:GMC family oxidoreductase N-terminal domain-containing protein [Desulfatibacillum aliphaticivorans]ACL04163.1 glucose-methanol-choline oxidoreductase [Desulfatibacillum aliphaticivorans]
MQYDAIIVGTGPGGASTARGLSAKGARVLMLEWGGGEPFNGSQVQSLSMIGAPGKNVFITPQGLIVGRATTVGGSTSLYCATAFDPPREMLERYGVDVSQEAAEVLDEIPCAPLKDSLTGEGVRRLAESARSLGYDWKKIRKFIYQDKCRLDCYKCYTGCPYGAKWTARNFAHDAVANGAHLLDRARVRRVIVRNGRAEGVVFRHKGRDHKAFAPMVVLGAGGLETPIILRRSGIKEAGFDFFVDPLVMAFGVTGDSVGGGEVPMTAGVHFEDEGIMLTDLSVHPSVYMGFTAQMMRFDQVLAHKKVLGIMVKIRDDLGGRLTDRGGVMKNLGKADWGRLRKGYGIAKKILKGAGAVDCFKTWYIAGHPGGTAKIGDVVDANLMTRIENLFVCDCSVIPEAWGVPPSYTLASLGKRLAAHIAAK